MLQIKTNIKKDIIGLKKDGTLSSLISLLKESSITTIMRNETWNKKGYGIHRGGGSKSSTSLLYNQFLLIISFVNKMITSENPYP